MTTERIVSADVIPVAQARALTPDLVATVRHASPAACVADGGSWRVSGGFDAFLGVLGVVRVPFKCGTAITGRVRLRI